MKTRYMEYTFHAVRSAPGPDFGMRCTDIERCEDDEAEMWGVYGTNPDGTQQHIGDAVTSDDAESITALLNWLIKQED